MSEVKYTQEQICDLTGIPYNTICNFTRTSGQKPTFKPTWPARQGSKYNLFSEYDLDLLTRYKKAWDEYKKMLAEMKQTLKREPK